ncbi:MAG: acyl--CoA ligase [Oscillospiraceae bacterium]|nr:acyl--CoA ligase [Oscillospiraceae bacterium]
MRFESFEQMLSHYAEKQPEAPALIFSEAEKKTLSYAELLLAVRELAAAYRADGKSCIGILSDGSAPCVISIFAAVMAGLQVVMLDAKLPEETLGALMQYTDVDCLWGDDELCEALLPYLTQGVADGAGRILFFTSGTTERSKAVVLTEHSLCQSAYNGGAKLPLAPSDRLLCMLPLGHVFGFVCGLLWGLSCGAAVALGRGARHYADDCAYFAPTALSAVPLLLGFLVQRRLLNPGLRLVLVGAGDCPRLLLDAAATMGLRVSFGYGLTETSSGVAISVGGDPFAMEVCPDDTITLAEDGEILIEAPTCMMQGYYKRPEDTAAVLTDGVLHTGDLGRFDEEGKLHITGRKKDMLVLSDGTKVFLPEYEGAIMRALDHEELAVILLGGRPALVYSGDGDEAALHTRLRALMAGLPRGQQLGRIIIVDHPLPRTATGKIKRWELQQEMETL